MIIKSKVSDKQKSKKRDIQMLYDFFHEKCLGNLAEKKYVYIEN